MKESYFRRLLNSLLDRQERANALARIASVVAGLTACALALAPVLESTAPANHFTASHASTAPAGINGAEYLPAHMPVPSAAAGADDSARQIETF